MSRHRLEITVDEELLGLIDGARGHEPRASFVKRAIRSAVEGSSSAVPEEVIRSAVRSVAARRVELRGSASPSLARFSEES